MSAVILLGTQGWNYPDWVGPFYPPGTRAADMLRVYARAFPTVEVDSTFYAIPAEAVIRSWRERVSEGFGFALKVPQEITHEKRLIGVEQLLHRFCGRASALGTTVGPLLIQLSPEFHPTWANRDALRGFLELLPIRFRWAIEFRHPGWLDGETLDLLRMYGVALALADSRWIKRGIVLELAIEPTADFAYVRWMGEQRRITDFSHLQIDREAELAAWVQALGALASRVQRVFGYFNNQYQGHSPESARAMQRLMGQAVVAPEMLQEQVELF
ncbi:MAG: DUF72 domain-containing protein [Gemmatimonadetes bacterium]|nr:DUF72 domain-containing protein [Gemmatimonadota bacterium]